jgi:tRNA(Ile2) C34 agmatinyltransferase TiaS
MGGVFSKPSPPPRDTALEKQLEEQRAAEEARAAALEKEQRTYKQKVAKGIIGARSLFGKAGGRGFFG